MSMPTRNFREFSPMLRSPQLSDSHFLQILNDGGFHQWEAFEADFPVQNQQCLYVLFFTWLVNTVSPQRVVVRGFTMKIVMSE